MRIASFNLESLDVPPRAKLPLAARIAVLRPQLERCNADILCLQEVNGQKRTPHEPRELLALDGLVDGTAYGNFDRASTQRSGGRGAFDVHNLVVLSRYPILEVRQLRHDLLPPARVQRVTQDYQGDGAAGSGEQVLFDRPLLQVTVELPGGRLLHVVNLHLRAPLSVPIEGGKLSAQVWKSARGWAEGYYLAEIMRAGQALEARFLIDELFDRDEQALILVCGDFNAEVDETPVRILQASEEDTGNNVLADRTLLLPERTLAREVRYSVLHHGRPQMLDRFMLSRSLAGLFRRIEVHNEGLADEVDDAGRTPRSGVSFHAPVVAEFAL
jgi:endonuclease/exonuclease/phosphatase family metal-dependent hydrolase